MVVRRMAKVVKRHRERRLEFWKRGTKRILRCRGRYRNQEESCPYLFEEENVEAHLRYLDLDSKDLEGSGDFQGFCQAYPSQADLLLPGEQN